VNEREWKGLWTTQSTEKEFQICVDHHTAPQLNTPIAINVETRSEIKVQLKEGTKNYGQSQSKPKKGNIRQKLPNDAMMALESPKLTSKLNSSTKVEKNTSFHF